MRNSTYLAVIYTCLANGEMAHFLLLPLKRQVMKVNLGKSSSAVFVIFVPLQKNLHFFYESERNVSL